jgi:hypothetical protein
MPLTPQTKRIIIAIIIGIILGLILSIFFITWLWLPLIIGVCFIFSYFCKSASDVPEESK